MKNALCFLTVKPNKLFLDMIEKLTYYYKIFIMVDSNKYKIPKNKYNYTFIQLNEKVCEDKGYKSSVLWCNKRACSRDKALYYFTYINHYSNYKFIWFIEEDVFIPRFNLLKGLDEKYENIDLILPKLEDVPEDWNLYSITNTQINNTIPKPWFRSMICALRLNSNMMKLIHNYTLKYKTLFLDEVFFPTLAIKNNLSVQVSPHLKGIVYRNDWKLDDIEFYVMYHPIKKINRQIAFRSNIDRKYEQYLKNKYKFIIKKK